MKKTLLISIFGFACCYYMTGVGHEINGNKFSSAINRDTVIFSTQVLPLLQQKCSPCHFDGGKMYEKMPFDKGLTILKHESGILKRFGDKPGAELIRLFIDQSGSRN